MLLHPEMCLFTRSMYNTHIMDFLLYPVCDSALVALLMIYLVHAAQLSVLTGMFVSCVFEFN